MIEKRDEIRISSTHTSGGKQVEEWENPLTSTTSFPFRGTSGWVEPHRLEGVKLAGFSPPRSNSRGVTL